MVVAVASARRRVGRNTGRVRSSSKASNPTTTGMPMATVSGVMPATLATSRVPSSSSTSATTSG